MTNPFDAEKAKLKDSLEETIQGTEEQTTELHISLEYLKIFNKCAKSLAKLNDRERRLTIRALYEFYDADADGDGALRFSAPGSI